MESLEQPFPAKFICGVIFSEGVDLELVHQKCESLWGNIQDQSQTHNFSLGSSYYSQQMGAVHHRYFVSFVGLVDPVVLAERKRQAIELEAWASKAFPLCARPLNLDPGLLMRGRMVLATTKDFSHRVYLSQGIYAEVTLQFKKKTIVPLPWTYPDILQGHYNEFLWRVKELFLLETKANAAILPKPS